MKLLLSRWFWLFIIAMPFAVSAATLSVTPSVVSNNYTGAITLQVGGLTNNETVLIEKFADINGNGLIDSGEPLIQTFSVSDGASNTVAGVRNINIPGDDDGLVNAQIRTSFNLRATTETERSSGSFVYRATPQSAGAVSATFQIVQVPMPQRIVGTITTNGVGVPGAFAALLSTNQQGNNFLGGVLADAAGNFVISNAPGTFQLIALKPGLIGNFGTAPVVTLNANQSVTNNIALVVGGSRTISGKFADAANSSIGLPLGQVFLSSQNGDYAVGYSDNKGNFNFALNAGNWKLEGGDATLALFGYLRPQNKPRADLTLGNLSGVTFSYTKGSALVYGTVKDELNNPLVGVEMFGNDGVNIFQAGATTDPSGRYALVTSAGNWNVNPSSDDPQIFGSLVTQSSSTNISNGQAIQENFVVKRATAQIIGSVKDGGNVPITNLFVYGNSTVNGTNVFSGNTTTDVNGNYSLPAFNGTWSVGLDTQGLSQRGYPGVPNTNVIVSGATATANFVVRSATAHLRGRVIDANGVAQANLYVFAIPGTGGGSSSQSLTDGTGSFDLAVNGGAWILQPSGTDMSSRNMVGPSLNLNVTDGLDQNGIILVTQPVTRQITGALRNYTNAPIAGVTVSGNYSVNGTNYSSSATTDGAGNYLLGVFVSSVPGAGSIWNLGVDNAALSSRGYGGVNQQVDVVSGSVVANLFAPIFYNFRFRIFTAPIGDFGASNTPSVTFPVSYRNYRISVGALDTNYPAVDAVTFTGPNGSGISGLAADPNASDPATGFYSTGPVLTPNYPAGGQWNLNYKGAMNTLTLPDAQVATHLLIPLPTVVVSNDVMRSVSWTYYTTNGSPVAGLPPLVAFNLVEVFDQNLNFIYQSPLLTNANSFVFDQTLNWSQVGRVRMRYLDDLNNFYFVIFTKKIPTIAKTGVRWQGNQLQFTLNGLVNQNYTVQSATDLTAGNWTTLFITNNVTSPYLIVDPGATNKTKFYRVLVGP